MPTKYPDISPAQVVAAVAAVVTQFANAQLVTGRTEKLIIGIAGVVIPAAWMIADAIIRHGRSRALAPHTLVETVKPTVPPQP